MLFRRVADLDFDLRNNIPWEPDEIGYTEHLALKILVAERNDYQEELQKQAVVDAKPTKWSNVG